jgi:hypothetical protein
MKVSLVDLNYADFFIRISRDYTDYRNLSLKSVHYALTKICFLTSFSLSPLPLTLNIIPYYVFIS